MPDSALRTGCRSRSCKPGRRSTRSSSRAGSRCHNPSNGQLGRSLRLLRRLCPRWRRRRCSSSLGCRTGCWNSRGCPACHRRGRHCCCRGYSPPGTCPHPRRLDSTVVPSCHRPCTSLPCTWCWSRCTRSSCSKEAQPRRRSRTHPRSRCRRPHRCSWLRRSCRSQRRNSRLRHSCCRHSTACRATRRPAQFRRRAGSHRRCRGERRLCQRCHPSQASSCRRSQGARCRHCPERRPSRWAAAPRRRRLHSLHRSLEPQRWQSKQAGANRTESDKLSKASEPPAPPRSSAKPRGRPMIPEDRPAVGADLREGAWRWDR